MEIKLHNRAEVALRSLDAQTRKRVMAVLHDLELKTFKSSNRRGQLRKLGDTSHADLYVARATAQLRLVVSIKNSVLTVEDIVPLDRIDRLMQTRR